MIQRCEPAAELLWMQGNTGVDGVRPGLKSCAKINLTLEVLYRREDGYHQLRSVFQEIELHDTIFLEEAPAGRIELICSDPTLPTGKENLAYRAAALMQSLYAPGKGVRIGLVKRIPVAAGLGGGSSNAATVLKGINNLWNLALQEDTLGEMGAGLGSDVPFFIYGGTALVEGRGEIIKPLPRLPQTKVLLAAPENKGLSAARVYGALKLDKIPARADTGRLAGLIEKGCRREELFRELFTLLRNDLETPVFELEKDVYMIRERLAGRGLATLVSGSGPTVFALSDNWGKLQDAGKELIRLGHRVIFTETVS